MSTWAVYYNWERLVTAVLRRQENWELSHAHSWTPSPLSEASDLTSSTSFRLDDELPLAVSSEGGSSSAAKLGWQMRFSLAGNMWQHLKMGPSLAEAVVGRIAHSTKVLREGGYENLFQQTFESVPEEKLVKSYGCYSFTSAGPVVGTLYLSTAKIAFCSDNPISYEEFEEVRWSYYKVNIPLQQLKTVYASASKTNPAEKYIRIIPTDNRQFWFTGFFYYDSAVKNLQDALQP